MLAMLVNAVRVAVTMTVRCAVAVHIRFYAKTHFAEAWLPCVSQPLATPGGASACSATPTDFFCSLVLVSMSMVIAVPALLPSLPPLFFFVVVVSAIRATVQNGVASVSLRKEKGRG